LLQQRSKQPREMVTTPKASTSLLSARRLHDSLIEKKKKEKG